MTNDLELRIKPDKKLIKVALETVKAYAEDYFANKHDVEKMVLATEEAVSNVLSYGWSTYLDDVLITVTASGGEFVVCVYDKGLLGDYDEMLQGTDRLGLDIMKGSVDIMSIDNLGHDGRRQKLIKYYSAKLDENEIPERKEAKIIENAEISVRRPKKEEILELCRTIYGEYGFTYFNDIVYYPERFYEANENESVHSVIAVDQYGSLAGHLAAVPWDTVKGIWEVGIAVVLGEYRNAGIFGKMMDSIVNYVHNDVKGNVLLGGAVIHHPYSQKVCYKHGLTPCGFKLNLVPPGLFNTSLKPEDAFAHEALCAIVYDKSERTVFLPPEITAGAELIYSLQELPRIIIEDINDPTGVSISTMEYNNRLKKGTINFCEIGEDFSKCLNRNVVELKRQGAEGLMLYLPVEDKAFIKAYEIAKTQGFFFSGLIPATDQGDVILMNNLLAHVMDYDSSVTIEPFTELLNFVKSLDPDYKS